jgi:hypothetical protein
MADGEHLIPRPLGAHGHSAHARVGALRARRGKPRPRPLPTLRPAPLRPASPARPIIRAAPVIPGATDVPHARPVAATKADPALGVATPCGVGRRRCGAPRRLRRSRQDARNDRTWDNRAGTVVPRLPRVGVRVWAMSQGADHAGQQTMTDRARTMTGTSPETGALRRGAGVGRGPVVRVRLRGSRR